jgi:CHAT domain-containing protein
MKSVFTVITIVLLLVGVSISQNQTINYNEVITLGEKYFNVENPTPKTDLLAKNFFLKIASSPNILQENAIYFLKSNNYLGVINQSDSKINLAKNYYKKAIDIGQKYQLIDSLSFKPLLYLSTIYYNNFAYDSCYYYLNKAEKIQRKFPYLSENERLYNSFGALYFESGNFRQSLEYFQKAINVRKNEKVVADFSFRNNIASALHYLNKPDSSLKIFNQLEKEFPEEFTLKLNIASVYIDKNQPEKALEILNKLRFDQLKGQEITYFNLLGRTHFLKKDFDKAKSYLLKAINISQKSKNQKNTLAGISYRILGEIAQMEQNDKQALYYFQKSIIQLDFDFNQTNFAKNPTNFNNGLYSFNLFKSLKMKAICLKKIYDKNQNQQYFLFAENSFKSLKILINTISNSFNNEDSRLDFKAEIRPIFQANSEMFLAKYRENNEQKYLIKAFEVADEGKATVLSLTINEENLKQNSDIPDSLYVKEKMLSLSKNAIIRQLDLANDKNKSQLEDKLNDLNVNILRLNDELDKFPTYHSKKYESKKEVSLISIQKNLNRNDRLVYFFEGKSETGIFLVGKELFKYFKIQNIKLINSSAKNLLKTLKAKEHFQLSTIDCRYLYENLITPLKADLPNNANLIIIADGLYNLFPFEVLKNSHNRYLIEKWPVSYLYSAKLIESAPHENEKNVLAIAPFDSKMFNSTMYLPSSKNEVLGIENANPLLGKFATKEVFLKTSKNYKSIHLATHAFTNDSFPLKSYIQFFPKSTNLAENRLYLYELSPGILQNNSLVFLSACESIGSQQIDGEGIRGLSRAFYLAGSKNIISSIWKAEDYSTAYLATKFYKYLSQGKSYEKALQLAKIDFINDPQMAQFHSPNYWAHLIFIGNNIEDESWFTAKYFFLLFGALFLVLIFRKSITDFLSPKL